MEGSGSEKITTGSDPEGPKTYGSGSTTMVPREGGGGEDTSIAKPGN
jgi:hypothetical protein